MSSVLETSNLIRGFITFLCCCVGVYLAFESSDTQVYKKTITVMSDEQAFAEHITELFSYAPQDLQTWRDFPPESHMLEIPDAALHSRNVNVSINRAHGEGGGLLHKGVWVAVLRLVQPANPRGKVKRELLLVKRAPSLKTCPGAWGLVGEHSRPHEGWQATALRAVREELNLVGANVHAKDLTLGHSLLVRTQYNDTNKRELQATKLFSVSLRLDQTTKIGFDDEVAEFIWVSLDEVGAWLDSLAATAGQHGSAKDDAGSSSSSSSSSSVKLSVESAEREEPASLLGEVGGVCNDEVRRLLLHTLELLEQRTTPSEVST
jgi:8-oxo-dGTP pyrophosphatase MutT (NUDIX family)